MPTRTIATRIAIEGEKEFAKALKNAGREMRVLGSELQVAQAEFEKSGDRQTFLTKKTDVLNGQLEQQKEVVRALEANIREMSKSWGEGSEDADKYAIQLNNARAKAATLEKQLNETEKELEDVDDGMEDATKESRSFARAMERNVEEAAEDSEQALKGLGQELLDMRDALDDIRSMEGVQLGMDIAGGAWDAAQALFDYTEEARDYNRQLAMLEINAGNARIDYSTAETEAFEAASYIGELDSALEGVNELLAAGLDATQFVQSMDLLTGAAMRFPDTLKFESLADGMQETLATGQGAGQFAELLERMGVDIEEFNKGLAAAKESGDEVDYTLTYLSQHGLADTKRQFGETYGTMVEAEASTLRLEKAWMSFGEAFDPVMTLAKNGLATLLESAAEVGDEFSDWVSDIADSVGKNGIGGLFYSTTASGELADAPWMTPEEAERIRREESHTPEKPRTIWDDLAEMPLTWMGGADSNVMIPAGTTFTFADIFGGSAEEISTEMQDLTDEAATSGTEIPAKMAAGLDEAAPLAVASAQNLADQVQSVLNTVAVPNFASMAAAGFPGIPTMHGMPNIVMQLNGRKVGELITPYVSSNQGRQIQR